MAKIDYTGRVAIVTGAGGGLGKTYAVELGKRGAKVVVNDFGGSRDGTGGGNTMADDVVNEIKAAGGEAVANYDGVHTHEGGANLVKQAIDTFGKVDIVVNNAGILRDKSFTKMEEDLWDPVIAVHLKGAYNVTQPAFLNMRENGYGRIVMTTSGTGLFGNFGQTNYGAAKLGLVGPAELAQDRGREVQHQVQHDRPCGRHPDDRGHHASRGLREAEPRVHNPGGTLPVLRDLPGQRPDPLRRRGPGPGARASLSTTESFSAPSLRIPRQSLRTGQRSRTRQRT